MARKCFYSFLDKTRDKQEATLKQWDSFESEQDDLLNWFKNTESKLRDQPLQDTLATKEEQLKAYSVERDTIFAKEKDIDSFVDKCHALLQVSQVQRIKPLVAQITSKYQTVHSTIKEIVNHWQNLVDNHRKYQEKLKETSDWLKGLEEHLSVLQEEPSKGHAARLQVLLSEKEQGEHKMNSLVLVGERLFPDTSAQGREKIRNELREIRERWDNLEEGKCVETDNCCNIFTIHIYRHQRTTKIARLTISPIVRVSGNATTDTGLVGFHGESNSDRFVFLD